MTTISNDLREGVLSYLRHQAAKGSQGIRDAIEKGHEQVLGLLEGMSEEQATFKATRADWCVLELLRHVEESERAVARRCLELARGEQPPVIGAIGTIDQPPFTSLAEARSALEQSHQELLTFVDGVSPETNLEATWAHPWFGPLNCREWAAFQRVHDGDHAGQIGQIKASPGFQA